MPIKLFVASLPTSIRKRELIDFFSNFGEIRRVELVTQKNSKKGKGFSFVTFKKEEDGEKVLNQRVFFKGRQLSIRRHLKGKELEKYRAEFTRRRMFVGSIPLKATEEELYKTFLHMGTIEKAFIIENPKNSQRNTKYGYVVFRKIESLENSLEKKFELRGQVLNCQKFRGKSSYQDKKESANLTGNLQNHTLENGRFFSQFNQRTQGYSPRNLKESKGSSGSSKVCGEIDFSVGRYGLPSKVALRANHKVHKNHYRSNVVLRKPIQFNRPVYF